MTNLDDVELRRRYRDLRQADGSLSPHPSEDEWVQFAEGLLDDAARMRLADHVVACALCADTYRVVAAVRDGARDIAPDAVSIRETPSWRLWYGLSAAALLALTMSGTWWIVRERAQQPPAVAEASSEAPAAARPSDQASTPASPGVTAQLPVPRAWAALPVAPAVSLPAALVLVTRGAPAELEAFVSAFGAAIAPYRDGRYGDAATRLDSVTRSFSDVPEGWFYLGVARLLSDDAAGAIAPFERADASSVVGDEAAWLKAVALERAGRASDASEWLRTLCNGTRAVRQRACAAEGAAR